MPNPPQKMKAYESYADWRSDQSKQNQALIAELEKLIKSIAPHLETTVKWGQGCWLNKDNPVMYIHTEADYVQLGFYNGSALDDPDSLLKGNGKFVRHLRIEDKVDVDRVAFTKLIKQVLK